MMSTPCGPQGFFYETWQSADPAWHRVSVPATQCPRISKHFLDDRELKPPEAHRSARNIYANSPKTIAKCSTPTCSAPPCAT